MNQAKANTQAPSNALTESPLRTLVRQLLEEPYAQEHHLAESTIEQLGKVLEEAAEEFEKPDLPSELRELAQSYARCKDLYCRLLLEWEHLGPPTPAETPLSQFLTVTVGAADEEAVRPEVTAGDQDAFPPLENVDPEPPARGTPLTPKPRNLTAVKAPSPEEAAPTPDPEPAQAVSPSWEAELPVTSKAANECLQLADFLRAQRDSKAFPVPKYHADRLIAQVLCSAVEVECRHKFIAAFRRFWLNREEAFAALFEADKRTLVAGVEKVLQELAAQADIFPEKKFPLLACKASLRYLAHLTEGNSFSPSLVDWALLFLFLGRQGKAGTQPWSNALGIQGIEEPKLKELCFLLIYLQRLKTALGLIQEATEISSLLEDIGTTVENILKALETVEARGEGQV